MKLWLLIGPEAISSERVLRVLTAKRRQLLRKGVLVPQGLGATNHSRLFMAVSDPDRPCPLRLARGLASAEAQARLRDEVQRSLRDQIAEANPEVVILSAHQLAGGLIHADDRARLADLLHDLTPDVSLLALWDDPARMALRHYTQALLDGRSTGPEAELALCDAADFFDDALAQMPACQPEHGIFGPAQAPAFWLDALGLARAWEAAFGPGALHFASLPPSVLWGEDLPRALKRMLDLPKGFGKATPDTAPPLPPAAWLARARQFNALMLRWQRQTPGVVPRVLAHRLRHELWVEGPAPDPGALAALSRRFAPDLAQLCAQHRHLDPAEIGPDPPAAPWQEADPLNGFRPTQYLAAFLPRLTHAAAQAEAPRLTTAPKDAALERARAALTPEARALMPPDAVAKFAQLRRSAFAPHDRLGADPVESPPFPPAMPQNGPANVLIACMKNEAPYLLEWIAHHRALGFDGFLIYSNDCDDGTAEMLDRLDALGVIAHRDNSGWSGPSPQQHALDRALTEPMVQQAPWVAHIDVDEFINIRCGDGSLAALLSEVPQASHIAMTWRLFGHCGQHEITQIPVTAQFDHAAPRHCPKPHTVWGFKTLMRGVSAYEKLSCHRPNGLRPDLPAGQSPRWVNGSGQDITGEMLHDGWRSTRRSIGYDLVQLNHYALRSADSFLVKRARGRALHVDRKIGLNYWLRMDWSDVPDRSIRRHLPRTLAALNRLRKDEKLAVLERAGLAWHRAKARALRAEPEFADLYRDALALKLTPTERAAWALVLDTES